MPPKSDNLINRTNSEFWKKNQISKNPEKKSDDSNKSTNSQPLQIETKNNSTEEKKFQKKITKSEKITPIASHKRFQIEKENPPSHPVIYDATEPKETEKNSWHKVWPTAVALCLCLALLPFIKNINQTKENPSLQALHPLAEHPSLRGLAVGKRETKKKKLFERYKRDNERAIYKLRSGQRKLASIGRNPNIKDNFSHILLNSRYRVKWRRSKLNYLNILKGKEPLPNFDTVKSIIRGYSALFPTHESIQKENRDGIETLKLYKKQNSYIARIEETLQKNGFSIAQMDTYTLKNKGSSVATVAVFTDNNGLLLAMHVQ